MLKFLRRYNKIVLVIGASLLMIAFLLEPVISMLMPSGADRPIGETADHTFTAGEFSRARGDLLLLERMLVPDPRVGGLLLDPGLLRVPMDDQNAAEHWMLMLHEAEQMGLGASRIDVDEAMRVLGIGPEALAALRGSTRANEETVRQAVRDWLVISQYRDLMLGISMPAAGIGTGSPGLGSLKTVVLMLQGRAPQDGVPLAPPLSAAVARHTLVELSERVEGRFVLIEAEDLLDSVGEPSPDVVTNLYDTYQDVDADHELSDDLPLPFGYRVPKRLKLEYLTIPIEPLLESVEVRAAEVTQRFMADPSRYAEQSDPASTQPAAPPELTVEVNARIASQIRHEKAAALGEKLAREAQRQLSSNLTPVPRDLGYYAFGDTFEPIPMQAVADRLRQTGSANASGGGAQGPSVAVRTSDLTQQWLDLSDLAELPDIGGAFLIGRPGTTLTDYAATIKELKPASDNPLTNLRLQAGVPSEPLQSWDGSYYVFRITTAEPDQPPTGQAEVGEQLILDARLFEAYTLLKKQADQYQALAARDGLDALTQSVPGTQAFPLGPVPRRDLGYGPAGTQAPPVTPLLDSTPLLDKVFDFVSGLQLGNNALADLPRAQRVTHAVLPRDLAVAVVEVERLTGLTEAAYQRQAASPIMAALVGNLLDRRLVDVPHPLSFEAIKERLGYQSQEK